MKMKNFIIVKKKYRQNWNTFSFKFVNIYELKNIYENEKKEKNYYTNDIIKENKDFRNYIKEIKAVGALYLDNMMIIHFKNKKIHIDQNIGDLYYHYDKFIRKKLYVFLRKNKIMKILSDENK